MNIENVKALAEIINTYGLSKLEISEGETKICLEKSSSAVINSLPDTAKEQSSAVKNDGQTLDFNNIKEVKSPMVGVFYAAPSPDADPFVIIGSKVKKGDVLCIIEAMKLMNEITAESDGEVVDICVKNGDIAEYGQVLFKIF